jgi:Mg2+ and Co2+ transporter CorA
MANETDPESHNSSATPWVLILLALAVVLGIAAMFVNK